MRGDASATSALMENCWHKWKSMIPPGYANLKKHQYTPGNMHFFSSAVLKCLEIFKSQVHNILFKY